MVERLGQRYFRKSTRAIFKEIKYKEIYNIFLLYFYFNKIYLPDIQTDSSPTPNSGCFEPLAKERSFYFQPKLKAMLRLIIGLLIIALIAAVLGFGGIAGAAAGIAQIVFYVFVVLLVLSLIFRLIRGA